MSVLRLFKRFGWMRYNEIWHSGILTKGGADRILPSLVNQGFLKKQHKEGRLATRLNITRKGELYLKTFEHLI